jgi:hypothetical protein
MDKTLSQTGKFKNDSKHDRLQLVKYIQNVWYWLNTSLHNKQPPDVLWMDCFGVEPTEIQLWMDPIVLYVLTSLDCPLMIDIIIEARPAQKMTWIQVKKSRSTNPTYME